MEFKQVLRNVMITIRILEMVVATLAQLNLASHVQEHNLQFVNLHVEMARRLLLKDVMMAI